MITGIPLARRGPAQPRPRGGRFYYLGSSVVSVGDGSSVTCHSARTQWNRLRKNGTHVAAATRQTQQWIEKTNNRIEIENRAPFECGRTGFWKSGFDFVRFVFPAASSPLSPRHAGPGSYGRVKNHGTSHI